jgi:hypothetical protein
MVPEFRCAHFAFAITRWASGSAIVGVLAVWEHMRKTRLSRVSRLEARNIASLRWPERVAAIFLGCAVIYFAAHVIAAWLRGSFSPGP